MYGTAYRSLLLLPLQSTHLKTDWINTGHYKTLNTIGKQNYQEPGVEAELNFEFFEILPLYLHNNDMGTETLRYAHNIRYVMLCYINNNTNKLCQSNLT